MSRLNGNSIHAFDAGSIQSFFSIPTDSKLYHAFPLIIDRFLRQNGIVSTRQNATRRKQIDSTYTLPGQIVHTNGSSRYCVIAVLLTQDAYATIAGSQKKTGNALMDEFGQWQTDFQILVAN